MISWRIPTIACLLTLSSFVFISDHSRDGYGSTTAFTEIGAVAFDNLDAGNFLSVGDWNSDGWEDLLVNGNRLYVNSGPPSFALTHRSDAFASSTSGSQNGAWADLDGDGDLDLYQGCGLGTADRLWINSGPPDYSLTDMSGTYLGTWSNLYPNTGNAWCDADGDGDLDIYVGNGEDWNDGDPVYYPDYLLLNEGGTFFRDSTDEAGMRTPENFYSRGATWGDFNNDHLPDLYVSHYRIRENHLFVNNDGGYFTEEGEVRNCSGLYDTHMYYDATAGSVYGQYWWGPTYGHTIGSAWADLNNDGRLDLFTSDFVHKYVGYIGAWYDIRGYVCDDGKIYINEGGPWYHFTDHRKGSGIPIWPIGGQGVYRGDQTFSGVTIGDYDNDGWQDIYIPQVYGDLSYTTPHLYRSKGNDVDPGRIPGTQFEDVTADLGIKGANTYANLFWDHDGDGDLDLLTAGGDSWDGSKWTGYRLRLYRNDGTGNHWAKVRLSGDGMNPDCIGARVTLSFESAGTVMNLTREVRAGTGHAHQQSGTLHFGLGAGDITETSMEVVWPDGTIQTIDGFDVDDTTVIEMPSGDPPEILRLYPDQPIVPEGKTVTFTVETSAGSSPIVRYRWDIDADDRFDVETTSPSVSIQAMNAGPARVRCRVEDSGSLAREGWADLTVNNYPPIIFATDMMVEMDSEFYLPFSAIEDSPSDLGNISWRIEWGDDGADEGEGATWFSVAHVYTAPGEYLIRVEARDEEFTRDGYLNIEVMNVAPWGWLESSEGNDTVYSEDQTVDIDVHLFDTASDRGSPYLVKLDWGDGNVDEWSAMSGLRYRHVFVDNGTYDVRLYAKDDHGSIGILTGTVRVANDPPMITSMMSSIDSNEDEILELGPIVLVKDTPTDMESLIYSWDLGDGNVTPPSSTPDLVHTYTRSGHFMATCTVIDNNGAYSSAQVEVWVHNLPPSIETIDLPGNVEEDQDFTVSIFAKDTPSDQTGLHHITVLDDGTVLLGHEVRLSFATSGIRTLTVRVEDSDGDHDERTVTIDVRNRPPSGEISVGGGIHHEDDPVKFEAVAVTDTPSDMSDLNFTWEMGDGARSHGIETSHPYRQSGTYRVKLRISDGDETVTVTRSVDIANLPPTAVLSVDRTEAKVGDPVLFSGNLSTDTPTDSELLTYTWQVHGRNVSGIELNWTFPSPGTYKVILRVSDPEGASSEDWIVVNVTAPSGSGDDDDALAIGLVVILFLMIVVVLIVTAVIVRRRTTQPPPPPSPYTVPAGGIGPPIPPNPREPRR